MVTRKAIENMYAAYHEATAKLREDGKEGHADNLFETFGHELSAWDAWYDDGSYPEERPDEYKPTMASLNVELKEYGYKAIGGKNPRIVSVDR